MADACKGAKHGAEQRVATTQGQPTSSEMVAFNGTKGAL